MSYMAGNGELAQMVERSLSMCEVPGSIPGFSKQHFLLLAIENIFINENSEMHAMLKVYEK